MPLSQIGQAFPPSLSTEAVFFPPHRCRLLELAMAAEQTIPTGDLPAVLLLGAERRAPCIEPKLVAPSASGVLPHGFR